MSLSYSSDTDKRADTRTEGAGRTVPKGLQYVDLMEKNTNQMLQLVNQILDFRKIQNGKMRLHVSLIDFNEMIASFQKRIPCTFGGK